MRKPGFCTTDRHFVLVFNPLKSCKYFYGVTRPSKGNVKLGQAELLEGQHAITILVIVREDGVHPLLHLLQ